MLLAHFTTSEGQFTIQLFEEKAPKTVANFTGLAEGTKEWTDPRTGKKSKSPYYNGTVFHRVIDKFMIQGGGFDQNMTERPTRPPVPLEAGQALSKGLRNYPGTISMARTSDPDSATGQFFINVADNSGRLDPKSGNPGYTVFGKVVSGMEVVNKIKEVPTGNAGPHNDVPLTPVVITSATIVK